jgi:hypothetical protein
MIREYLYAGRFAGEERLAGGSSMGKDKRRLRSWVAGLAVIGAIGGPALAQTPGLVPLNDLGTGSYEGLQGGLYPGGQNVPPPAHMAAALAKAAGIVPRDATGAPHPEGLIVMVAIGMSNTTHEFGAFERNEDANTQRNARVVIVDTALGGQTATAIANPSAPYWTTLQQRLAALGLTAAQVQVAWLKEAEARPADDFPVHAQGLRANLELIANNLHDKFPNLGLCYVSSRIYGGYAPPGSLNPEPQAYESGFSVKWLIEDQINGDTGLNHGQLPGPVRSPLLLWGPYLWANGPSPRSDGLVWLSSDLEGDMTHPSASGEGKVAGLLSAFFASDPTAAPWWGRKPDAALLTAAATKDAHVAAASPGTNFGSATQLIEQGGAQPMNIYLGFDVAVLDRPVLHAKLSARVTPSTGGGGRVSLVGDTSWGESAITYASAPAIGSLITNLPQSSRDGTIGVNVTAQVNADPDGLLSFALTTTSAGQASYHSREAGQPPRLVMIVSCLGAPPPGSDADGDGRRAACDCAPSDPAAFAVSGEIEALRWPASGLLAWDSAAAGSGSGTRYDLMAGDLRDAGFLGTGPDDLCLHDGLAALTAPDTTVTPAPGEGRFFLVRGQNVCGAGRYESTTSGADRLTTACP